MENNDENIDEDDYNEYDDDEFIENKIEEPEDEFFNEQFSTIEKSKDKIQDLNNLIEIDKLNYPQGSKWSYKCYEKLCLIYKENKDISQFILCFKTLMKLYQRMDNIIIENLFYRILDISFNSDFDSNTTLFQETIINEMLKIIKFNNYNKAYTNLKSLIIKIKNYSFKNDSVKIFKQKITDINQDIFSIKYSEQFVKILKSGIRLNISHHELSFLDEKKNLLHEKEFPMKINPINVEVMDNGDIIILHATYLFNIILNMIILKDDKFQIINLYKYVNSSLIVYNDIRKTLIKEINNKNKFIFINPFSLMIIFSSIGNKYIIETILVNPSIFAFYEELNNYSLIVEWNTYKKLTIKKLKKNEFNCIEQKTKIMLKDLAEAHIPFRNIELFNENYLIISLFNELFFILLNNYEVIKRITLHDKIYCLQKIDNNIVVLNSELNFITQGYNNEFQIEKICDIQLRNNNKGLYYCSFLNINEFNYNYVSFFIDHFTSSFVAKYYTMHIKLDID